MLPHYPTSNGQTWRMTVTLEYFIPVAWFIMTVHVIHISEIEVSVTGIIILAYFSPGSEDNTQHMHHFKSFLEIDT